VSSADAVAAVLWIGVTLYAVFGGADFGAGAWALLAGRGESGKRPRALVGWAIGPVWEANHVWLIFVLVVLWTAFSSAFGSIMSTLFVPLSLAALGIVLRGSGFAFHKVAYRAGMQELAEFAFAASSVITPFFMGTVVGAIASGQVPVGNAAGDPVSSWTGPAPILTGVLFVATGAYLSAVFRVSDARRAGDSDLERYFADRALAAAVVAGGMAIAGLVVYHADARYIYDGLVGDALPLVIVSAVCGAAVLAILWRGGRRGTRPLAVGAVVAVVWGWGAAQHPYLLPQSLTISEGAGAQTTLEAVLIVFAVAVLVVLPSLGFLYTLTQRSVLREESESRGPTAGAGDTHAGSTSGLSMDWMRPRSRRLTRSARRCSSPRPGWLAALSFIGGRSSWGSAAASPGTSRSAPPWESRCFIRGRTGSVRVASRRWAATSIWTPRHRHPAPIRTACRSTGSWRPRAAGRWCGASRATRAGRSRPGSTSPAGTGSCERFPFRTSSPSM
jgi:cytochrome bd ubiquinol oxidase subunit II